MPIRDQLVLVCNVEHLRFLKIITDDMQTDWTVPIAETDRNRHRRHTGQIGGTGVDIR